jgi:predicted component of type VI protein secretion system
MITVRVDDKKRIWIRAVRPGDGYHLETMTRDLIVLRRIQAPQPKAHKRMTHEEVLRAIENSPIKFTKSWDELKTEVR